MSTDIYTRTLEDRFPESCADRWLSLLEAIRGEKSPTERERQFLFAHGFVCALENARLLGVGDKADAVELLIWARHRSHPSPWPWADIEKSKEWPPAQ
ncbi:MULTISPECIES: hypothetical protein [Pseudomonas]|uniref:hypothetical protein n=1 Tax=Pseudomonas TaxID=286 RepID=UPI001267BDB5|nr:MULTISPECIES: hypothetical protein [Pseudomonas]NWE03518.1 hypothetical protein [Pseudomonas sp. IPO3749]NWF24108.1 hypothetical protein [Pseudomonas sp. IPO3749]